MSDQNQNKEPNKILTALAEVVTPDNIQKYIFGYKKSGHPRALHDIVEDYRKPKKKKKHKKDENNSYSFYVNHKKAKKKKKKKKSDKHWHI